MKKTIFFIILALALIAVLIWFGKKNNKSVIEYETEKAFKTNIVRKSVATGTVIPLEEVEIKPQVSGIIDKIFVKEGQQVKVGDLIAKIRVVPNVQALNTASGDTKTAKLRKDNAKVSFDRTKALFDKGVVAKTEFESSELTYNTASQDYEIAINNQQIIKKGSTLGSGKVANTNIRATIKGTILEIPVRKGNQVIESNTFNAGTTIAIIADMNKMIFEGKVDEAEVGKLIKGTTIDVSLGAIQDNKFPAILTFIAPKGNIEQGAVQFKIKADVTLDEKYFIRAGYSANANIILEKRDSVLSIREALLRFDKKTDKPYVDIKTGDQEFTRKDLKLGVSDGVNVEILEGVTAEDEIKIWNKASKDEKKDTN
ncbi:MAG: efflux RND transporter periplasmic adaptor subunit [Flavobacteriaceae bacterium]|nr:efflux RND transporter periplasmic adaptor subunit [Flavobacteriaceae bacterium]